MKRFFFLLTLLFMAGVLLAQKTKTKTDQKFDKTLLCPFEKGMGREPKEPFSWDPPDMKVIMRSQADTTIRCCIDAKVLSINPTEDGRYEMVVYYKEYYFWYYGVTKPLVNTNQQLKAGQVLGTYTLGQELEFRMFKDEEMIDPREFLECKVNEGADGKQKD